MDLGTFQKATEIYGRLEAVNEVIKGVTVGDFGSPRFRHDVATLAQENTERFLRLLNDLRIELETEFNELHCECPPGGSGEDSEAPEVPVS